MSLIKTTKETNRDFTELEKYSVFENLPEYFETEYPTLVAFLDKYYQHSFDVGPQKFLKDLEYKRDFVQAQDELLRFFSQELLLGRDYFDRFIDKQTAVQTSNLLYRSKGTKYSIQQFFRVFFGFDVDINYGRDEVFIVGDPAQEELIYKSEYRNDVLFPGRRLRFKFDDGEVQFFAVAKLPQETVKIGLYVIERNGDYVNDDYVEDITRKLDFGVFFPLRQEIDFTIDYDDKSIVLQPIPDGYSPVVDDPWINELAETGIMPVDQRGKVLVKRHAPANSAVGYEVTNKRITNNGFWQMFALAIRAPISINQWREAYKDFVHPAGMYLEGEVLIQSTNKLFGTQPTAILEEYKKPAFSEADILARMQASITELNLLPFAANDTQGYTQSGFVTNDRTPQNARSGYDSASPFYSEERLDSAREDLVYRTRLNDITNLSRSGFTLEELDTQYQRMDRIDTIEARRFDNVEADFSSTINTADENQWYGEPNTICVNLDSNYKGPTVLGSTLDFPDEYAGCPGYIFNLFGLLRPLQAQYTTPKFMDRNPTYLPGDSDGFGGGPFPPGLDSDPFGRTGNPIPMADSDFRLGSIVGIQYRTTPGAVAGLGSGKLGGYRDKRVWGTTNDPANGSPNPATNYSNNPSQSTSRWDSEMDYANAFQFVEVTGVARNVVNYFQMANQQFYIFDSNLSPGDSADYMQGLLRVEDSFGTISFVPAYLDSDFGPKGP